MSRRTWPQRIVLMAAAWALVLEAAVPMVAAGAAQWRAVSVADVCPVYGVDMADKAMPMARSISDAAGQVAVPVDGHGTATTTGDTADARSPGQRASARTVQLADGGQADAGHHGTDPHGGHSADSCALAALVTFATPDAGPTPIPALRHAVARLAPLHGELAHDACALWSARRKQGPPGTA